MRKGCYNCKWFQLTALDKPPPGILSFDNTARPKAFQLVYVNYADPIYYKDSKSKEAKAYIQFTTCSLTRASSRLTRSKHWWIDLVIKAIHSSTTTPRKKYTQINAKAFERTIMWIKKVVKNKNIHDFLVQKKIKW